MGKRLDNWEQVYFEWLEVSMKKPFKRGEWDCMICACDVIEKMTGTYLSEGLIGSYSNKSEADKIIKDHYGLENWISLIMLENNWPEIPILFAQRGDLLMLKFGTYLVPSICIGQFSVLLSSKGLRYYQINKAFRAWRIG